MLGTVAQALLLSLRPHRRPLQHKGDIFEIGFSNPSSDIPSSQSSTIALHMRLDVPRCGPSYEDM